AVRSLGLAEMDLIAGERGPARDMGSDYPGERLVGNKRGLDAKKSETRRRPNRTFEAVSIVDRLAEHLISAAQPKYGATPPHMRAKINVPAFAAKRRQIGDRRFRAGNDDELGVARDRVPRLNDGERHLRVEFQGIEI